MTIPGLRLICRNPGYRGRGPCIVSPRYMILSGIWDFIKRGRGIAPDLTDRVRLAFISKQEGVPSGHTLSFVLDISTENDAAAQQPDTAVSTKRDGRTPPPAPPPLRGGGELEAAASPEAAGHHCRTRRPRLPLVRHRPFGPGCGRASYWQSGGPLVSAASAEARAALPERPTQTGSGCPLGGALPRSQRRAGIKRQRCRPRQRPRRGYPFGFPTAPPVALAAPAPRPCRSAAQPRAGRFRSVAPCAPYRWHPVAHRLPPVPSLHDPRHRCCTGSRLLAALAPSCRRWRRTPQTAAVRPAARQGRRRGPQRIAAADRAIVSLRCCGSSGT